MIVSNKKQMVKKDEMNDRLLQLADKFQVIEDRIHLKVGDLVARESLQHQKKMEAVAIQLVELHQKSNMYHFTMDEKVIH